MEKQELQKLRDLPIEGVAERLGLQVIKHKCLCPFHDDHTPSLSFNTRKNSCRCFSCMKESIGTIDLVMRLLHLEFRDACRWLANENNIILQSHETNAQDTSKAPEPFNASRYVRFFEHPWLSEAAKSFLFGERKIDPRVVRWCRLTSWTDRKGVKWLQIPYYDTTGMLVGIQNRNLEKDGLPRFRFPKGFNCCIYNAQVTNLLKPGESLYISEGPSDCWSMLSSGHKAIAIPSATLLKTRDKEFLLSLSARLGTEFHMYPDNNEPGESLFLQLKEILPNLERHKLPPGCKDFSEYYLSELCHDGATN